MRKLSLGYGDGRQEVQIPDENLQAVLLPKEPREQKEEAEILREALKHPIGSRRLRELVSAKEKIAVITSDITRPMPTSRTMPVLLEELMAGGARLENITLVFGLGIHRRHTEQEKRRLAGDWVYENLRCVDGDPKDCVLLGVTSRGTPVEITREVAGADRIVCLGNIEYHYFAGYSGGGKALLPGVASRNAIQKNHSLMTEPGAKSGNLMGNPLREDIEEASALCKLDFILNVVLNKEKKIVRAVAGDPVKAHRKGCKYIDSHYKRELGKAADIVLVSQGGTPKDLNLYQMQKALNHAACGVRRGGIIIAVGELKEGLGEPAFEQWMLEAKTPKEITERLKKGFCLGGHKAAAIASVLEKAEIYLVSGLPDQLAKNLFMHPFSSAQEALETAFQNLGEKASVVVMPQGGSVLPYIK
jgi:nickel-dependent lactate racemase